MFYSAKLFFKICLCIPYVVNAKDIVLIDGSGESYSLTIDSSDSFGNVIEDLTYYINADNQSLTPMSINLLVTDKEVIVSPQKSKRDYHAKVTSKEKKDIEFLVTKMAWEKNPMKLLKLKSEMNKAGDRIINLHPFKFLETICTDDKLCAGLKAIRTRNILIWPEFMKGSVTSLKEEYKYNNVLPFVEEFADTIKVDVNLLMPLAKSQKWEEFVKTVADKVERANNPNRYDM